MFIIAQILPGVFSVCVDRMPANSQLLQALEIAVAGTPYSPLCIVEAANYPLRRVLIITSPDKITLGVIIIDVLEPHDD